MPSVSDAQRKASCLALACKLGKIPVSKLHPAAKQMYEGMTIKELSEFCHPPVKE